MDADILFDGSQASCRVPMFDHARAGIPAARTQGCVRSDALLPTEALAE